MRKINIQDDLRIGFPGRGDTFSDGVEIGMLATMMSLGWTEFSRSISRHCLEQARALGEKLGYHIALLENDGAEAVRLTFRDRTQRPKLRLVR
ncbi:MAG TPA: hypothetical protein VGN97_07655 [Mesorhizobium sp.]|jgi:hypothetical protein|nr:hypothetical protein [Mesorhizobium sp.]